MDVLLVQNHGLVGPDLVETSLRRRDVAYVLARPFQSEPEPLPDPARFDAVVVFGSPASCRDLDKFPELQRLRDLVAQCVAEDKAVLGICFGGQLLAHVLGADVRWNEAGNSDAMRSA